MSDKKHYALFLLIIISAVAFSLLGSRWHTIYYPDEGAYSPSNPPLATAMRAIHDGTYLLDFGGDQAVTTSSFINNDTQLFDNIAAHLSEADLSTVEAKASNIRTYSFITADDDYFKDACFIGDSRTVGMSQYAGIDNATFLCKNSLSIYDYDKKKLTYDGKKTSVRDVLSEIEFLKIYIMVGINECGIGTPESFFTNYKDVVMDIRSLQPNALIFIQGNLLVTERKSNEGGSITNENISARNELIATLANQKDIFYIDINESSLCEGGSLVSDYTWDQVHIKAQYYPIWKDFLLEHAIITQNNTRF